MFSLVTGRVLIDLPQLEKKGPRGVAAIGENMCKMRLFDTRTVRGAIRDLPSFADFAWKGDHVRDTRPLVPASSRRAHRHNDSGDSDIPCGSWTNALYCKNTRVKVRLGF